MECDCGCDDYGESCDISRDVVRKARKQWTCCECGEAIMPGEYYEQADSLFDGTWYHTKTCILCVRIRKDLCGACYSPGELRQTILECLGFDYITGKERNDATRA